MPELVLGPLLRFTSATEATVWVEVDEPCSVEVLGATAPTFSVEGHHYALVVIEGLAPAREQPYEVRLDGAVVWPDATSTFPPSVIRTLDEGAPLTMAFGSCRVAVPHEPPWNLTVDEADEGFEHDALRVLAQEMIHGDRENWPDYLLLLGDQVYVDLGSPTTRAFIRSRRDTDDEPGEEVVDYEEYSQLYREAWSDPVLRWLFSTVSVGMIWDDHDMGDDWNISRSWVEEMDEKPWWHRAQAGRLHRLLDPPARREPLPGGAGGERALVPHPRRRRGHRWPSTTSPGRRARPRTVCAGATPGTSGPPAWWSSRPGPAG